MLLPAYICCSISTLIMINAVGTTRWMQQEDSTPSAHECLKPLEAVSLLIDKGEKCNKTNPTYTFFLTITTLSSPYRSFCIPYCLPLLSHDMSSCQHRSYSCDTNSITNTSNSHSMSHSMLLFSHHDQLSTSPFITFPLHDQLLTSHDILSTSIPTPRPTLHFSIHYIPTP